MKHALSNISSEQINFKQFLNFAISKHAVMIISKHMIALQSSLEQLLIKIKLGC